MAMPYMNVLYDWRVDIRSLWFYHSVRYKNGNTVDLVFPFYMYIIKNYKSPRRESLSVNRARLIGSLWRFCGVD